LLTEDVNDVPFEFVAVIVNVYACENKNVPVTDIGEDVPEYVSDIGGEDVIDIEDILLPPLFAVNGTETSVVLETDTVPIVGVCGTVVAVTADDAELEDDVP
jgi:hypothetical protein